MNRPPIAAWKKLLFSFLVFALFFYGLDRACKKIVQSYQIPVEGRDVLPGTVIQNSRHSFVQPDATRIWALDPGIKNHRRDILINEHGFRGDELEGKDKTLVTIGDSCIFGWGVGHSETIAVRLAETLAKKGHDIEVINAGVPGYSSLQALNHLEEIFKTHAPDIVTVQIGWNDFWPTPALSDSEIVAKGAQVISFNFFVRKLWAVRLCSHLISKRYYAKFKSDQESGKAKRRVSPSECRENLDAIVALCRKHDATPILLTLPQRLPIEKPKISEYLTSISESAAATGAPLIDLIPPIQSDLKENEHLFVDNIHFSAEGSRAIAEIIAKGLADHSLLSD